MRNQRSQKRRQVPTSPQGVRRKPDSEPIPDLWEVPGARIPANPRFTDHETEYTHLTTVTGDRACVREARVVRFKADSAGLGINNITKLQTPKQVPELWAGKPHHVLTHALRLLQVTTVTNGNGDMPDMRRLRDGITPTVLLKQAGLTQAEADEVIKKLKDLDVLVFRSSSSSDYWYVHLVYKGFGPQFQKYTKADLIDDWMLPNEEVPAVVATATSDVDSSLEEGVTMPDGQKAAHEETKQEMQAVASEAEKTDRMELLNKALNVLRSAAREDFVASNGSTAPDGYIQMQPDGGVLQMLSKALAVNRHRAASLLQDLGKIGFTKTQSMGPRPWLVLIKKSATLVTEGDMERIRAANRKAPVAKGRLAYAYQAYLVLVEAAPKDAVPDEKGYIEYETRNVSYPKLICEKIEALTLAQAERLIRDFQTMEILTSRSVGSGGVFRQHRRLRLGIKKITQEDLDKVRGTYRRGVRTVEAPKADTPPDEIEQIFAEAAERLESYAAEIEELKAELKTKDELLRTRDEQIKQLERELSEARAKPTISIPEALRRHLPGRE